MEEKRIEKLKNNGNVLLTFCALSLFWGFLNIQSEFGILFFIAAIATGVSGAMQRAKAAEAEKTETE